VAAVIDGMPRGRAAVGDFLGRLLTRPRLPLRAPARPLDEEAFARRLRGRGRLALALPTRGLVRGGRVFLNAEAHSPRRMGLFKQLLNDRSLRLPLAADARTIALLHGWYLAGYVAL
jgi:hypothetical protein